MEKKVVEYPCTKCEKECTENTIECKTCKNWSHIKCYPELEGKKKKN